MVTSEQISRAAQHTHPDDHLDGLVDVKGTPKTKDVMFSRSQLALLEQMFPEPFVTNTTTDAALRYAGGQRSVVRFIRDRAL